MRWQIILNFQRIFTPYNTQSSERTANILLLTIICFVIILIFGIIVAFILPSTMTKPINLLVKSMKKVKAGDFECKIDETRNDEFGELYEGFNDMVVNLDGLIHELSKQKYEDNGKGIEPHVIDSIRMDLEESDFIKEGNFALKNINNQIRMFYGERYGLMIDSEYDYGTVVKKTKKTHKKQTLPHSNPCGGDI